MPSPPPSLKTAAIISRPDRNAVAKIVPGLLTWLAEHGYKVILDPETAQYAPGNEVVPRSEMGSRALDLAIVLGGTELCCPLPGQLPQ